MANTKRFHLGLEWSWQLPQVDSDRLIPELELSIRYDLRPNSMQGPSLSLHQEYGTAPASSGLDHWISCYRTALEEDSSQLGLPSRRSSLKGEWGFALDDGTTGIPYTGLSSSNASSGFERDLTLVWQLLLASGRPDTKLDIKTLRR